MRRMLFFSPFLLIVLIADGLLAQSPSITGISPTTVVAGEPLTITGTGFGSTNGYVIFGTLTQAGGVSSWSDTQVVITVPPAAPSGSVPVSIENAGGAQSGSVNITVDYPTISSLSATSVEPGQQLTITGSGFGSTNGYVIFGTLTQAGGISSWTDTQVVITVPPTAPSGSVAIENSGGAQSNSMSLTVNYPNITSISPSPAVAGQQVTITGTYLGSTNGYVVFGNVPYYWTSSWTDTQIVTMVPANAPTTASVYILTSGAAQSNSLGLTVNYPAITSVSPSSAVAGQPITITGTGFGGTNGYVIFGNITQAGGVTSWDDTQVVITVPPDAPSGSVSVSIENPGGAQSNFVDITVGYPTITSISPTMAAAGQALTITGMNFGTTSTYVIFGNLTQEGGINSWTDTQIVIAVPTAAQSGPVSVENSGGAQSNSVNLTIAPTITNLSPSQGAVGTSVTITGTGFGNTQAAGGTGSTVIFGTALASPTSWSDTSITVTVPAVANSVNVVVTVNGVASNGVVFSVTGPAGVTTAGSNMSTGRWGATATLLTTGMVLVAGGNSTSGNVTASAELYDQGTGIFALTGDLSAARRWHTATLLNDGRVLIAGGVNANNSPLASAEIYDPLTGSFTTTGNLNTARYYHSSTVLNNGTVLIAGGIGNIENSLTALSSAEIFDPATGTFTVTAGSLNAARQSHTATLLNNGMVLICGGAGDSYGGSVLAGAEIYVPNAGTFSYTGSMQNARYSHTATLLNGGEVLMAGGWAANGSALGSAEIYDPTAGSFATTGGLSTARGSHAAALLNNGTTLLAGGWDSSGNPLANTEIYDPAAGAFLSTGALNTARGVPMATLLPNGMVLVAGGLDINSNALASTELYQPVTLTPPGLVSIALSPLNPSISAGVSQQLTATGTFSDNSTQTLASATWNSSANAIATVTSDVSNFGTTFGVAQGSATVSACTGTICGSTTVTVSLQAPLPPEIQGLAPGSATVGSWVAISGSNFGAQQGSGSGSSTVSFGGAAATIVSWSDTAVFVAVPSSLTPGQTVPVVVTTSVGASNSADFLPVSTSAPYIVSPQNINLLVGQTRTITVTDSSGNAVTGLEWTTSNASVVSLSTDDPPIITGVAPGTAIVYVVGMPILVTVYSGTALPTGTPIWSVPVGSGSGNVTATPAVPSASGVDVFAADSNMGAVTALRSDGSIVWKSLPVGTPGPFIPGDPFYYGWSPAQVIPDFSGNAILKASTVAGFGSMITHTVNTLDPSTGAANVIYTFSTPVRTGNGLSYDEGSTQVIIPHPSGVLFIQDNATVNLLNPSTGQQMASVTLENSTQVGLTFPPQIGSMIVAGDGNAYLPYAYFTETSSGSGNLDTQISSYLNVLWMGPDGSYAKVPLGNWTGETVTDSNNNVISCSGSLMVTPPLTPGGGPAVITNAATGAAVFANLIVSSACGGSEQSFEQMSLVSQNGLSSQVNVAANTFTPTLQREDGSYIGSAANNSVVALGLDGSVVWQQSLGTSVPPATPLYATADGGAIVTTTCQPVTTYVWGDPGFGCGSSAPLGTLYTLDQNGNVTSQTPDTGAVYSWTNQWYVDPQNAVSRFFNWPMLLATAWTAVFNGNQSGTGASVQQQWFPPLASCYGLNPYPTCPGPAEVAYSALNALRTLLREPCQKCEAWVFEPLPGGSAYGVSVQPEFSQWLDRPAGLYDGTLSKMPLWWLCSGASWDGFWCAFQQGSSKATVADYFQQGGQWNISETPSPFGLLTFYDPHFLEKSCAVYSSNTTGLKHQSVLFHESLHGFFGLFDDDLQEAFDLAVTPGDSTNITEYIAQHVFGVPGISCAQ